MQVRAERRGSLLPTPSCPHPVLPSWSSPCPPPSPDLRQHRASAEARCYGCSQSSRGAAASGGRGSRHEEVRTACHTSSTTILAALPSAEGPREQAWQTSLIPLWRWCASPTGNHWPSGMFLSAWTPREAPGIQTAVCISRAVIKPSRRL